MIGFLTACFPLSMMINSFAVSKVQNLLGERKSLLLSIFIAFISAVCYGSVYYVDSVWAFVLLSMLARILHGFEDAVFEVMSIHYLQSALADLNQDKAFSTYKMGGSAGYIIGGIIAPLLVLSLDHFLCFMVYGISFLLFFAYFWIIIPTEKEVEDYKALSESNVSQSDVTSEEIQMESAIKPKGTQRNLIKNRNIVMTLMC